MSLSQRKLIVTIATVILVIAVAFYYFVDPEKCLFAPKCVMYAVTGYKCPSCGIQRFLHHWLHGEYAIAMRYNYFLVLCLPYAIVSVCTELAFHIPKFKDKARKVMGIIYSANVLRMYVLLYVGWWIFRNMFDL